MNPNHLEKFKSEIASILKPLSASRAHKQNIQEELLAHLAALYTEELNNTQDPDAAARAALERFGNPQDLTTQLQSSISPLERLFNTKETAMRRIMWFAAVGAFFFGTAMLLPALARYKQLGGHIPQDELAKDITLFTIACIITLAGVGGVLFGIIRFARRERAANS